MGKLRQRATALWARRRPVVDGLLALGIGATTAVADGGAGRSFGVYRIALLDWSPPLWYSVPLGLLVGGAVWWRRRWPALLFALGVVGWLTMAAFVALLFAQYSLAERTLSWWKVAAGTLVAVVAVGFPIWRVGGPDAAGPLTAATCLAPALLGMAVGTRRELVGRIRERAERAEREQLQRIQQARSDERAQIARDMHDVVTHRVSLIVLHATALEAAQGRHATTIAERIGTIGREALDELRSLVEVLRADDAAPLTPQPGLADLADLVAASRRIGVPVTYELADASGVRAPALVEHAVYRVVQEALVNVHKHAGGAPTQVRVELAPEALRLSVTNGRARGDTLPSLPRGGHGLLGIAERVRLVGGELTARPTPDGGFAIAAEVPLKPEHER